MKCLNCNKNSKDHPRFDCPGLLLKKPYPKVKRRKGIKRRIMIGGVLR